MASLGNGRGRDRLQTRGFTLSAVVLAWCLGLIAARVIRTGSPHFLFLVWNLFLACVPLAASRTLTLMNRRRVPTWAQGVVFCLWLLFLPNAPYIVTDLVHVAPLTGVLSWYDSGMVLSCAGAGLLVGYLSLRDMQQLVDRRIGRTAGWLMTGSASILSGFGVYLGRVLRWNSWDVLTDPIAFLGSVASLPANAGSHAHTYVVTLLFGLGLLLSYTAMYFLTTTERNVQQKL